MQKNYYVILGVGSKASPEEIKTAFRRRAMELHPDRSGMGTEPFRKVQEAYSVLSDPAERRRYDDRQAQRIPFRSEAEPLVPQASRATRDASLAESFEQYHPSFEELFDRLWSNFLSVTRPRAERQESLTVEVVLSRLEAQRGGRVRLHVPARVRCAVCGGRGHIAGFECRRCDGQGVFDASVPVVVEYPPSPFDSVVRLPLTHLGIGNFFLAVHFRVL